jgi:membrane protein
MGGIAGEAWATIKEAGKDWVEDKAAQQGAALAFYSVLSLAPLVVVSLVLASAFVEDAGVQFGAQVESMVGKEGAEAIGSMVQSNKNKPGAGSIAGVLGIITLIFGASGVFGQLQESMNTIWDAKPNPKAGVWGLIRSRFLSFAMVLGTGFLLLVSLLLSTAIAAIGTYLGSGFPGSEALVHTANAIATFIVVTLLFAMIFKLLPDKKIAWRDVWVGALLTAILFTIGKMLIGLYLGKAAVGSSYGAAGSLVVLLVWIYYSSQVLFFGAELAHTYAERRAKSRSRALSSGEASRFGAAGSLSPS